MCLLTFFIKRAIIYEKFSLFHRDSRTLRNTTEIPFTHSFSIDKIKKNGKTLRTKSFFPILFFLFLTQKSSLKSEFYFKIAMKKVTLDRFNTPDIFSVEILSASVIIM